MRKKKKVFSVHHRKYPQQWHPDIIASNGHVEKMMKAITPLPILYSFRRCPYAMRARLALSISGQQCVLREIVLRDKPKEMLDVSAKATVPVLVLPDGGVLEESLDIMLWALEKQDLQQWLSPEIGSLEDMKEVVARNDGAFKYHLDRYKYATRYTSETDPIYHREEGTVFLNFLEKRLARHRQLFGNKPALADFALFPFVRQFANTDRDWFDTQPFPHLQKWLSDHLASDLFSAIMIKWPVWTPEAAGVLFPGGTSNPCK